MESYGRIYALERSHWLLNRQRKVEVQAEGGRPVVSYWRIQVRDNGDRSWSCDSDGRKKLSDPVCILDVELPD